MNIVVICAVIMAALGVHTFVAASHSDLFITLLGSLLGIFAGGILGSIIGAAIAFVLGIFVPKPKGNQETKTTRLASLRSSGGIQGSFFLGSGSIESQQYYRYYEDSGDGGYTPCQLQIDSNVTVYEEDRKDAELVVTWTAYDNRFIDGFVIQNLDSNTRYAFHVPRGSILQEFVLN